MSDSQVKQRLLLPEKARSKGGAQFSIGAIFEALDFLEIAQPVEVKWSAGLRRRGSHRFREGGHIITVSTYLDADELSTTLWHELVHCAQLERFDETHEFNAAYTNSYYLTGYHANKFEVEAREVAEAYASEFRLAK
jgi:hypothetical protein